MNESKLKKEFKQSDVQRVRNIVNKDFTSKTKNLLFFQKFSTLKINNESINSLVFLEILQDSEGCGVINFTDL